MSGNRERAAELLRRLVRREGVPYEYVAAALDAAEARGRAEMAAKVEALAAEFKGRAVESHGWTITFRDRLRALLADAAPAGQDETGRAGR